MYRWNKKYEQFIESWINKWFDEIFSWRFRLFVIILFWLLCLFLLFNSFSDLSFYFIGRLVRIKFGKNFLPVWLVSIKLIFYDLFELNNLFIFGNTNLFNFEVKVSVISVKEPVTKENLRHSFHALNISVTIPNSIHWIVLMLHFTWSSVTCLKVVLFLNWVWFAT